MHSSFLNLSGAVFCMHDAYQQFQTSPKHEQANERHGHKVSCAKSGMEKKMLALIAAATAVAAYRRFLKKRWWN